MPALISVVIPTYNRAATLPGAIASVLRQTYADFELIVVDDGSADDTAQVVAAIDDARLRYVPLPRNGGVSAARNRGIQEARGAWVAFQDSDDEWLPRHLEALAQAAQELGQGYGLVVCLAHCPEDAAFGYPPFPGRARVSDFDDRVWSRLPASHSWLARREDLLRAGLFDPQLNCFEDWELALRLRAFTRIGLLNEVQHIYHRSPGGLFSNEAGYVRNLKLILERHAPAWAGPARDLAMYQTLIGHMACLHGSQAEGRQWFRRAIATAPSSPRPWLSLGASLLGRPLYRRITEAVRRRRFARNQAAEAGA